MSWVADGANSEFNTGFEERIAPTAGEGRGIVTVSEGYRQRHATGAFYRPPDDRGASELPHEAQLGAVAVVILRLGVGLARLVDER